MPARSVEPTALRYICCTGGGPSLEAYNRRKAKRESPVNDGPRDSLKNMSTQMEEWAGGKVNKNGRVNRQGANSSGIFGVGKLERASRAAEEAAQPPRVGHSQAA